MFLWRYFLDEISISYYQILSKANYSPICVGLIQSAEGVTETKNGLPRTGGNSANRLSLDLDSSSPACQPPQLQPASLPLRDPATRASALKWISTLHPHFFLAMYNRHLRKNNTRTKGIGLRGGGGGGKNRKKKKGGKEREGDGGGSKRESIELKKKITDWKPCHQIVWKTHHQKKSLDRVSLTPGKEKLSHFQAGIAGHAQRNKSSQKLCISVCSTATQRQRDGIVPEDPEEMGVERDPPHRVSVCLTLTVSLVNQHTLCGRHPVRH